MFTAALFITPKWKQPTGLSAGEWVHELRRSVCRTVRSHETEGRTGTCCGRDELQVTLPSGRGQSQKTAYCVWFYM